MRKKRKNGVITPKIKQEMTDLVLKIIGDTVKAKFARIAGAATIAVATNSTPEAKTATPPVTPVTPPTSQSTQDIK